MASPSHYRQLSLPTGTETLQLQEAARHRRIVRTLEDLFARWGYDPAETAMVDYFDVYRRLLDDRDTAQVYRAVDRQGEVLALRSDTTLFLARQLGMHLSDGDLPVRVFYSDQIVRAEDRLDIAHNEYQQAGIELVGVPGTDGDAEVLLLAGEALNSLNRDDAVLHIGSHEVIAEAADAAGIGAPDLERLVRRREFDAPELASALSPELRRLLAFIGPADGLAALLRESGLPDRLVAATQHLVDLAANLETVMPKGWTQRLRIDLSELGAYHYYTGIAFSAYLPWTNAAVLRGGRYDQLLEAFGFEAPSVGFSIFTRKLPGDVLADTPESVPARTASGTSLSDRVAAARRMHADGQRSQLS